MENLTGYEKTWGEGTNIKPKADKHKSIRFLFSFYTW